MQPGAVADAPGQAAYGRDRAFRVSRVSRRAGCGLEPVRLRRRAVSSAVSTSASARRISAVSLGPGGPVADDSPRLGGDGQALGHVVESPHSGGRDRRWPARPGCSFRRGCHDHRDHARRPRRSGSPRSDRRRPGSVPNRRISIALIGTSIKVLTEFQQVAEAQGDRHGRGRGSTSSARTAHSAAPTSAPRRLPAMIRPSACREGPVERTPGRRGATSAPPAPASFTSSRAIPRSRRRPTAVMTRRGRSTSDVPAWRVSTSSNRTFLDKQYALGWIFPGRWQDSGRADHPAPAVRSGVLVLGGERRAGRHSRSPAWPRRRR